MDYTFKKSSNALPQSTHNRGFMLVLCVTQKLNMLVFFWAIAFVPMARGQTEAPAQSKANLQQELDQYSSYHRSNNRYGEVRSILDQLRRTSAIGTPDSMQRVAHYDFEADPNDETELSKNRNVANDLFEGDLVLTVDQANQILDNARAEKTGRPPQRQKRKVVRNKAMLWPTTTIHYTFNKDIEPSRKAIIYQAVKAWEDNTCLHFQEGTGQGDYLMFFKGSGCYSHVGRSGGQQAVSIGDGCAATGIVAHEIAHSLGFWHEQNRYDRTDYITIKTDNIYAPALMNFMRIPKQMMNDYGIPYDLGSVMHYGAKAFSYPRRLNSIETVNPNYQNTIGQRQRLSFIDVKQMNMAYCSGVCKSRLRCQHDGYPDPSGNGSKCNRCKCPLGFGGTLCEDVGESESGCGGVMTASSRWQTVRVSLPTRYCMWLLKAPNGGRVVLEVTKINVVCQDACSSFLEIKKGPHFDQTGFRFCCPSQPWNKPITSNGSEISVVYKGLATNNGNWGVEFRFRTESSTGGRALSDIAWSQWSPWSDCSEPCGGCGFKSRRRDCVGEGCGSGLTVQRRPCGVAVCTQGDTATIDSMCRYEFKVPCPDQRDDHQIQIQSEDATLTPTNCGTTTTFYMCSRSSPNFVRLLKPEERNKRVLASEWNQSRRDSKTINGPCCNGYQQRGDECIRISITGP